MPRLLFWRRDPWEKEAELSRPWVDEAQANLAAAELDVRRTKALFEQALSEARAQLAPEDPLARLQALESLVDRVAGDDARTTEKRLRALEHVLRGELELQRR